jgi:hypothetical protein
MSSLRADIGLWSRRRRARWSPSILAFDPHEDRRIDRLRTGKAAEQAPGDRGGEEQRGRGQDQDDGQQQRVLRPQDQVEQVELLVDDVEQDRLPRAGLRRPRQPARAVEHDLGEPDHRPAQAVEAALHRLGVDLSLLAIELQLGFAHLADGWVHAGCSGSDDGLEYITPDGAASVADRTIWNRYRSAATARLCRTTIHSTVPVRSSANAQNRAIESGVEHRDRQYDEFAHHRG